MDTEKANNDLQPAAWAMHLMQTESQFVLKEKINRALRTKPMLVTMQQHYAAAKMPEEAERSAQPQGGNKHN